MSIDIRYARVGEQHVAYAVVGSGPLNLVLAPPITSNIEIQWDDPYYRRFLERLGTSATVAIFDKRGTGLSGPILNTGVPTLEQRMDDIRAVMDAVGSEKAAIIGESEGGPLSMLFAAAHPERTVALEGTKTSCKPFSRASGVNSTSSWRINSSMRNATAARDWTQLRR